MARKEVFRSRFPAEKRMKYEKLAQVLALVGYTFPKPCLSLGVDDAVNSCDREP